MTLHDVVAKPEVHELIRRALHEDIGEGDATSAALVDPSRKCRAAIVARGAFAMCGARVAGAVFQEVDPGVGVEVCVQDGRGTAPGETVLRLAGLARGILAAERTALNFLQRMTGIATLTRRFVERAHRPGVMILDTRKTTPTLRILERYAVRCGGGLNHRSGLHDRILIKDNHRALWTQGGAGADLAAAVQRARDRWPHLQIEIEVESEAELADALRGKPDWVLLDNMPADLLRRCVEACSGRARLEASGGITLENIEAVAATGVDAISLGCLTHSAPAADFSLEVKP